MKKEIHGEEQRFVVRPYSKIVLAGLYIPHCTPRVALRKFNDWLRFCPALLERLARTGATLRTREYTYRQVGIIVEHLGEP